MRKALLSSLFASSVAAIMTLAACSSAATPAGSRPSAAESGAAATSGRSVIYAAIGASETVGVGASDRLRQAWPQIFFNIALPESAVFYNFGFPGATAAAALDQELPAAVGVHPTVVTIWLNVNDLVAGVAPGTYETELQQLVQAVRQAGARSILIANTPSLDRLPAYRACTVPTSSLHCPFQHGVPDPAQLNALVDAYNAAIARVAAAGAAAVVDLHGQGEVPDLHPDWLSPDGFHPNAAGYAAIARQFKAVFQAKAP